MMKPLVSVIIPTYNSAGHISGCIRSVLAQTWENIEIIVIDDGSTDNTPELAERYTYHGVRVVRQFNEGACNARNTGILLSRGKYLQFLDADDLLSADKIESQVQALEANQDSIAVCRTIHFNDGEKHTDQPIEEDPYIFSTNDVAVFFSKLWGAEGKGSMVQTNAWMIPSSLVQENGDWDNRILLDQDGEFFTRIAFASKGIIATEGINYYRRYVNGSNVAGQYHQWDKLGSALRVAHLKAGRLLKHTDTTNTRLAASNLFMQLAVDAYPHHTDLYLEAFKKIKNLGATPKIPELGGKVVSLVSRHFGWKAAKRLKLFYKSILREHYA